MLSSKIMIKYMEILPEAVWNLLLASLGILLALRLGELDAMSEKRGQPAGQNGWI